MKYTEFQLWNIFMVPCCLTVLLECFNLTCSFNMVFLCAKVFMINFHIKNVNDYSIRVS